MIIRWGFITWILLPNVRKLGDYVVNVVEASSDVKEKKAS